MKFNREHSPGTIYCKNKKVLNNLYKKDMEACA